MERYSSTLFLTSKLEGGEGSASGPGCNLPPGKTRYPLYRKLGGPQGRSGQVRKISPPPGFDSRTVQPVGSRYTDYATQPIAWWVTNANNVLSEHVTFITFPRQTWLHERASMLHLYVLCVSCHNISRITENWSKFFTLCLHEAAVSIIAAIALASIRKMRWNIRHMNNLL
jgi:hypothetical protein